jgi:hypothetical protein
MDSDEDQENLSPNIRRGSSQVLDQEVARPTNHSDPMVLHNNNFSLSKSLRKTNEVLHDGDDAPFIRNIKDTDFKASDDVKMNPFRLAKHHVKPLKLGNKEDFFNEDLNDKHSAVSLTNAPHLNIAKIQADKNRSTIVTPTAENMTKHNSLVVSATGADPKTPVHNNHEHFKRFSHESNTNTSMNDQSVQSSSLVTEHGYGQWVQAPNGGFLFHQNNLWRKKGGRWMHQPNQFIPKVTKFPENKLLKMTQQSDSSYG